MFNSKKFYLFHAVGLLVSLVLFNVFNISISAMEQNPLFDDFSNFPEFPQTATNYMIIYNDETTSEGGYFAYFINDTELFITSDGTISGNIDRVQRTKLYYDSDGLPYWGTSYTNYYENIPFYYHNSTQTIIASTADIKNSDGETFFFYGMPLSHHAVWKTTTSQTLQQMFLITMAGLVKFLIPLLVGLVAFWKSWQLLLQQLRRA